MERLSEDRELRAKKLWEEVLGHLKERITAQAFETWFSETRAVTVSDDRLIIEVPNEFYIDWLEEHYSKVVREALKSAGITNLKLIYRPAPKEEREEERGFIAVKKPATRLQARYTFDNFVVGKSNEFAYSAARAVAQSPSGEYNPLFIYGGVGLGKTHLLQAIGNYCLKKHKKLKVHYVPAETFMNEMIRAIQKRSMVSFKLKYRQLDVLLIDDIQFLRDKEMLQEEIFHTFNSLYDAGKQIVMTSDRPPKEIPSIEERLVSRFQWGLVVDIKPPDLETRMAILRKKCEEEGIHLSDEIIHFIAQKVRKNIRELEGCLVRIAAFHSLTKRPITLQVAEEILRDMIKESRGLEVTDVIEAVSRAFNIPAREIKGKRRKKEIVEARQAAMYLMRHMLGMSLKSIGYSLGGRDHSTVIHSIEKVEKLVEDGGDIVEKIEKAKEILRSL